MTTKIRKKTVKKRAKNRRPANRPNWKAYLNAYPNKQRLVFASDADLDGAIDLLWTDALRTLPHASPDGRSIVIPAEAVVYFKRAGLNFSVQNLVSINDLSAKEIESLRV